MCDTEILQNIRYFNQSRIWFKSIRKGLIKSVSAAISKSIFFIGGLCYYVYCINIEK